MRLIFFASILLIVIAGSMLFNSNVVVINSVDVEAEKVDCTDVYKIRESSGVLGQNFFLMNSSKVENGLKQKFLCIKSVKTLRIFPNKVNLQVFSREPAATFVVLQDEEATESADILSEASPSGEFKFKVEGQVENFVVDNEGVIYSDNIEQVIAPIIYVSGLNLTLGQKIKEELIGNLLRILKKAKSFGVDIKEAKVYSRNVLLVNATPKIVFRLDGKIDTQIASLQLILQKAKIDEDILEFIDLRFDKQIVRFAPKKNGQR